MKVIETRENGSKRVHTVNNEPSRTDQQWKDDCDVNTILEKYKRTGMVTHVRKIEGQFADMSDVMDLHSSLVQVQLAGKDFLKLPAKVRSRFNNSIYEMVDFLKNPDNYEESVKLGLRVKPPVGVSEKKPDVSPGKAETPEVKTDGSSGTV